jgi:TFIIF-interacting CTD phosphatase-like protein
VSRSKAGMANPILKHTRDQKDIMIVSNSCKTYALSILNGVPVHEYIGDKQDLSFFSLARYLKQMKNEKDVRVKIRDDFFTSLQVPPTPI